MRRSRTPLAAGFLEALPMAIPVIPAGLVLGLLVDETAAVSTAAGVASAPLVMGGASQLAAVALLGTGAGALTTAVTIAVINARHVMYSARLQRRFRQLPRWFRVVAPYVLFDQVFALTELYTVREATDAAADPADPIERDRRFMAHYLGTGAAMGLAWWVAVGVGVGVGNVIPEGWSLDMTVPLLFLGLLVLSITDRAGVAAAVAGGAVGLAGRDLPNGSGLLLGAVVGVVIGGLVARSVEGRADARHGAGEGAEH